MNPKLIPCRMCQAGRPELGRGAKDLVDEVDAIDRVLDGKEMW